MANRPRKVGYRINFAARLATEKHAKNTLVTVKWYSIGTRYGTPSAEACRLTVDFAAERPLVYLPIEDSKMDTACDSRTAVLLLLDVRRLPAFDDLVAAHREFIPKRRSVPNSSALSSFLNKTPASSQDGPRERC